MSARDDVLVRIEEIEGRLRALGAEVRELRTLVSRAEADATSESEETEVARPAVPAPQPQVAAPPPAARPVSPPAWRAAILQARVQLANGQPGGALDVLERGISHARASSDREGLEQLASELEGIARYRRRQRERALELARQARSEAAGERFEPRAPAAAVAPARGAPSSTQVRDARSSTPAPPSPPGRGIMELARDWELLGPRGFAIVGGAVTALGITLLFVLAANRGWITPTMRVAIGALVSCAALGAGLVLRARYGQVMASLGAVGAGLAGGYASLAAASVRYDLVPDSLALPLAAVIAGVATAVALAWSSEIVAAIGLAGSALAPALQAIDTGMTWPAAAFAVIVLAAALVVAVPRRWDPLLVGIAAVVAAQVCWLVGETGAPAGAGTAVVAAALVLVLLAAAIWLQLTGARSDAEGLATSLALAAVGLTLVLVPVLYELERDRGLALVAAAGAWGGAWAVLRHRQPSFGLVLGISSLTLAAVASADLLSGTSLAVTWAAQSVLFSALAWRLRDARLQATALAYGALAGAHMLVLDAPPSLIFRDPVDASAAVPVAALALAALAAGLLAPAETASRTETGLLAWLGAIRMELAAHREGLREALVCAGAATGTYAAMLVLVSTSFRSGHLAATVVAAAAGACVTALSARRGSMALATAALAWLAVVMVEAALFDAPEFTVEAVHRSYGGWALIAAASGALAGAFAFQVLYPAPGPPAVPAFAGIVALAASVAGIGLLSPSGDVLASSWIGWRLLAPAVVLAALAAAVFRMPRHRDLATVMWALGAIALLGAEWLVVADLTWRAVAFAATAAMLAGLARPLREERLWLAGWSLGMATALVTVAALASQWADEGAEPARYATAALAGAVALACVSGLAWRDAGRRDLVSWAWTVGLVALIVGEGFLVGGGRPAAFVAALTGGLVALLAAPLGEQRLWWAGAVVSGVTAFAVLALVMPPTHFLNASASPASGLWVLLACIAGGIAAGLAAPARRTEILLAAVAVTLYGLSLAILELGERVFGGSVQTDFERGHVAVSSVWALIGLALLVAGLVRGSAAARFVGLGLFGLSLAKIFLYDLSALSSAARALSFIAVGALLLAGGFFLQRLSSQIGPRRPHLP